MQGAVKSIDRDVTDRSLIIINLKKDSPVYKSNEKYIEEQSAKMQGLKEDIEKLEDQVTDPG